MLMATIIGLGICASAYYIYKNQTSISLKLIRLSLQVEDCFLKFRGNVNYYLIPNEKDHTLECYNDISNFDFDNDNDILLRQAYDINDKHCEYYINVIDVNRKLYCFLKHYTDREDVSIKEEYKNFKSPILSCTINIIKDDEEIFKEFDITNEINSFLICNNEINLSNKDSIKKLWIYHFNYIGKNTNSYISYNNINNITLQWTILKDNFDIVTGNEITIRKENTECIFDLN